MNRLINFIKLKDHSITGKLFNNITKDELLLCLSFLNDNIDLTKNEFAAKLNRWYLDEPIKPKNLNSMWALLTECNN